ncbi:MAG TPA: hypothetical protein VHW69_10535 [Rhizomicrobium sp.]|jgi:hypothetical protein|nr:hypothetical protein [Rhizomicrobium sp.]
MTRIARILIASTALTILPLSLASADGNTEDQSDIVNNQVTFSDSISHVNLDVGDIWGDVSGQSVAGGNSLDVTTMNDTNVTTTQYTQSGAIAADLNANARQISGDVDLSAQAFCNSVSVSTDPNNVSVYNAQECHASDPSTLVNATVQDVGGNVSVSGSSIGNSFEEDTNAPNAQVQNYQLNDSNLAATVNSSVWSVKGSVSIAGAAIGNSAQIIHYGTGN